MQEVAYSRLRDRKMSGFELESFEIGCMRDRSGSSSNVAIVLAVLGCDSLVVVWFASGLVVVMEGSLVVGSPLAGLAGLPLALRRGCRLRWGDIGYRSSCVRDVRCALKDSIDDGFWRLVCT